MFLDIYLHRILLYTFSIMETTNQKNTATIIHLSTLSQYIFPFGNFILPIIIWTSYKKNSSFVESHGRNAINFQLSIFLYSIILCLIAIPSLLYAIFNDASVKAIVSDNEDVFFENLFTNWAGIAIIVVVSAMLFFLMKVAEFFLVIYAGVKASNEEEYQYPLTINFIKAPTYDKPIKDEPTISDVETSTE